MGTAPSKPKNKVGKSVVRQKLELASKTGVLSLREHKLETIPDQVYELTNLRTLDISKNNLISLSPKLAFFHDLKSLNCDENKLPPGSLADIAKLSKLQILSAGKNRLGYLPVAATDSQQQGRTQSQQPFPSLPPTLKQLKLDSNNFSSVPPQICDPTLMKLEKIDLSFNNLATIPTDICNLVALTELNLDYNVMVSLPDEVGQLKQLKALSLQHNQISISSTHFSAANPQPLPVELFRNTPLIDLNLQGNKMTNTQLNEFEGFPEFLERRKRVKSKNIYGGALTDLGVCGLD